MVRLLAPILDPSVPEERSLIQSLLQRLAASEDYALAWSTYQATVVRRGATSSVLVQNSNFETSDPYPPFGWVLAQEENLWAARDRRAGTDGGYFLRLAASGTGVGEAARQLLRLGPGRYRLSALLGDVAAQGAARPELRVSCTGDEGSNALLRLRPSGAGQGPFRIGGDFAVPSGCRFQWIAVAIAADRSGQPTAPWIDDIEITALPQG